MSTPTVSGARSGFFIETMTKGPKIEAECREWGVVLGRGSKPPPHWLQGLGMGTVH